MQGMFLSWLSKFLASLLVLLLFLATLSFVAGQTILSSHYVEGQLKKNDAYTKLSVAISQEVAKNADTTIPQSQLTDQLKTIITPEVLQQRLNAVLDQLEAYMKGNRPVPTLDVSDLVAKAQAAGMPAPTDQKLTEPITLGGASDIRVVQDKVNQAKWATLGVIALLFVLLATIAAKRSNYRPLANVFIALGVMLTLSGAALILLPNLVDKSIKVNYSFNVFAGIAGDMATSIGRDFGMRLLVIATIALVVGIVGRIVIARIPKPQAVQGANTDSGFSNPETSNPPQSSGVTDPSSHKVTPPKIQG